MDQHEGKGVVRKKTAILLMLFAALALAVSAVLGIAASYGAFAAGTSSFDPAGKQKEHETGGAPAYDSVRPVTAAPNTDTDIDGLYLFNPDGSIMPAYNNHLHIQVNFTYTPGSSVDHVGDNGAADADDKEFERGATSYTYKYSMDLAMQSLGNTGATDGSGALALSTETYYPRGLTDEQKTSGDYLFKIVYTPSTTDPSFKLTVRFNSMTPTGDGTFDIRYFGHPSSSTDCDYTEYTGADADYYYFDSCYLKDITSKQVIKVKVEMPFDSDSGSNGAPVPTHPGEYMDLTAQKPFEVDRTGALKSRETLFNPSSFLDIAYRNGNDYNGTYSFVDGSFEILRNDAANPGQKERFNTGDYFIVDYRPYVTDLVTSRLHTAPETRHEPVPTTVSGYTTGAEASYFSGANAILLKIKDGASVQDLYGYTFYCKAMVTRYGHTTAMQSPVLFSFRIDDPLLQISSTTDDGLNVPESLTLRSAQAGGAPTVLSIDQVVNFPDQTRYSFVEFEDGLNGGAFKYDDDDAGSDASKANLAVPHPDGGVRHAANAPDYYDASGQILVTASAISGDAVTSVDNSGAVSKIQFVRNSDHRYSKDILFVVVRVKDNRYVGSGDGTTLLCIRLATPSEGMSERSDLVEAVTKAGVPAFPYDAANGSDWATPLDGVGGSIRRAVSYVTHNASQKGEIKIMLHNFLKFKSKNEDGTLAFDFSDASTYANPDLKTYGVLFTADMIYSVIAPSEDIVPKFIPRGITQVDTPYGYQDTETGAYFSWMLTGSGELYVYPYRSTQELPGERVLPLDNAFGVVLHNKSGSVADSEVFQTFTFSFGVENSAPEREARANVGTLSENYRYKDSSGTILDPVQANVVRMLADTQRGYNYYKDGIANANAHNLKKVFVLDVYDVWNDVDAFLYRGGPQPGYDALSFIVSTNTAVSGYFRAPDKNYIQVYVLKEGLESAVDSNWVKLEDYPTSSTDRVRKLRFEAKSSTPEAGTETTVSITDNRSKRVSLTFSLVVEDSRPYYRAEDANPTGEAPVSKSSESAPEDALYRSAVMAYHPMMLRASSIADAGSVANIRFLNAYNNSVKGIDFYDGFQDVPPVSSYNVNDMLIDPDNPGARTLGFATSGGGNTVEFKLSDPAGLFDGTYTAVLIGSWYTLVVNAGGTDYFKVEFGNGSQLGVVRVTALTNYDGGNIRLSFAVTTNGAAIPDGAAYETYEYCIAIGLLDTLPTVAKSSATLDLTSSTELTFTPDSLLADGFLTGDGSNLYMVPAFVETGMDASAVKMRDFLQFWNYNDTAAGDRWTGVNPVDDGSELVYTVPGDTNDALGQPIANYKLYVSRAAGGAKGSVRISKEGCSPRNDAGKPRVKFYVTKFDYSDANLDKSKLSNSIADYAVPIELTFNFETPSFGIDESVANPVVTADPADTAKWQGAYYKIALSDLHLKEIAGDGTATGADVNLDNVTFNWDYSASDTSNSFRRNLSVSFADYQKPNLYFQGQDYSTRIGVVKGDVDQSADANYDIILNYDTKEIWVKPQSRTLNALYSEMTVNLSRPDGGRNKVTPITFTFAVPDSSYVLMKDDSPLATFDGLAGDPQEKGFFVGGDPVYLRVKRAESQEQIDAKSVVEYDERSGRRYLTIYADSSFGGIFRDLYDGYYFKSTFTAGANLTITKAENASELTVRKETYYSELKALPNAYAAAGESAKLQLDVSVADLASVGMNVYSGTEQAMTFQFSTQYAGITVGAAGQLDIQNQIPFYSHMQDLTWVKTGAGSAGYDCPDKAIGGCGGDKLSQRDSAESKTAVFCDGSRHYAKVSFTRTFGKLSSLMTSGDYSVDEQGKMTNNALIARSTLSLTLRGKDGVLLKETQSGSLNDLIGTSGALNGDYLTVSIDDEQNIVITLNKYYADEIQATLELTNRSTGSDLSVSSAQYGFKVTMRANETIIRQNSDSQRQNYIDVQLADGGAGYTASVDLSDYAYNFCGDDCGALTFGTGIFPDSADIFEQFYETYVSGTVNSDNTGFTLTLNKLHTTDLHAQEYQVRLPILRGGENDANKEARVRFFYVNDASETKVSDGAGVLANGKSLTVKDGIDNLYEVPTGKAMALYASSEYYMTDPYGNSIYTSKFFETVGIESGFILGTDSEIASSVHGALTFDLSNRNNGKTAVMQMNGDGTVSQVTGISGDRFVSMKTNRDKDGNELKSKEISYSGKGFDPGQCYSYMVQAAQRLTDESQFIRVTFVLCDTAGNRVTYPAVSDGGTEGLVSIDFRTVNSPMVQNTKINDQDFFYENNGYSLSIWSAGEAFRAKFNGEDREPGADELPNYYGTGFPLSNLIADGDYLNEDFEVYMNLNRDGTTMKKLSGIPSAITDNSGRVLAKIAYENKRLYFYALTKCTDLGLPEIMVKSAEEGNADSVMFNNGAVKLSIANSDPILRANAKMTFDVAYNKTTYVVLADYMFDYDQDDSITLANRDVSYRFTKATADGDVDAIDQMDHYVTRTADHYGVRISCKNLLETVGENGYKYELGMTLYYTADLSISLTANYSNPAPEFMERFEEGFDIPSYTGEELKIVYTGTTENPAKVGTQHTFNLNQFINLSSYLKNNQYITLTINRQSKQIKSFGDLECVLATFTIPENAEVGQELSVATFKIVESSGKLPVKKGTANKVSSVSLWIRVANTAPTANDNLLDDTQDKIVASVAPGSSVDILASSLATDVNSDELYFDVPRDPITDEAQVDITLSGSDDVTQHFHAKYIEQDGKYNKIRVTVDANYTGSENVVFNPLYVVDAHNARSETITKLMVKVVLKPSMALKTGYEADPALNNLVAYRSIPMKYDTSALVNSAAAQAISQRLAGGKNFAAAGIDSGTDLTRFNENTTLIDNRNLFKDTYAPYITVSDILDGEGYTVDRTNQTVTLDETFADTSITLPVVFSSGTGGQSAGAEKETIQVKVGVSAAKPVVFNKAGILSVYAKDKTPSSIAINMNSLVSDPHGRVIVFDHVDGGNDMIAKISHNSTGDVIIEPVADGNVTFTLYVKANGVEYYDTFTTNFEGYGGINWWTWLLNNPIYLGCIAGALGLILIVVVLMIAKHARKKRMMKELETMLLAEMEADEQLKLTNASMMNMGMPYNSSQLGTTSGYDPNVLNLNPGTGSQMQQGYGQSQMPGYGPGANGYNPNQFGQSQMQQGFDPNQFGQMPGYDANQFGQSQFGNNSQFGSGDGGYIDLDDFNNK